MTEVLTRDPALARLARKILSGLATEDDLRRADPEDVRAIKCDDGEVHYRAIAADVQKVKGEDSARRRKFVASQESVDRMGDIVRVAGWDFRNFKENPQVLWAHQDRDLPIGSVVAIKRGEIDGVPTLFETIEYHDEELNPRAEAIFRLVEAGHIKAVSVGFLPLKTHWPQSGEERTQMGLGPFGVMYEKQEQLELSNCTIPAHPAALASKQVRRALEDLVDEGKLGKDVAGELIAEIDERRARRKSWWTFPVEPELEDPPSVPAPAPSVGKSGGQDSGAEDGRSLEDCAAKGEAAPAPKASVARECSPFGCETLASKLDRCLAELAEVRSTLSDVVEAKSLLVEEVASLHRVLRSSARDVDPRKFYGDLLNEADKQAAQPPKG